MARVLVINDESDLLEMMQIVLESAGHSVRLTTDGKHAISMAQGRGKDDLPDVIVLDLVMPGTSGAEVFQTLLAAEETAAIPVVIMSALPDGRERAEQLGAATFLAKPFDPDALNMAINDALAARRSVVSAPESRRSSDALESRALR